MVGRLTGCGDTVVARGAVARDPSVVEARPAEGGRIVAVLTGVVGRDVIGRLAFGRLAIMAGEAIAGDRAVIEACRRPKSGGVAILAGVVGGDVVRRLALCCTAVMTAEACAEHRSVVHVWDRSPGTRVVTIITGGLSWNMISWFTCRRHLSAWCVAGMTLRWCTFKNAADMARFALDPSMGPREQKTCSEMIKIKTLGFDGFGVRCREYASTERYDAYKPDAFNSQIHRLLGTSLGFHFFFSSSGLKKPSLSENHGIIVASLNDFVPWHRSQTRPNLPRWISSSW